MGIAWVLERNVSQKLATEMMHWGRFAGLTLFDLVRNGSNIERMKVNKTVMNFITEK